MSHRIEYDQQTGEFCISDPTEPTPGGTWQIIGYSSNTETIRDFINQLGAKGEPGAPPATHADILKQWQQLTGTQTKVIPLSEPKE